MRRLYLVVSAMMALSVGACQADSSIEELRAECEKDLVQWQLDRAVPESCNQHLEQLKKVAGQQQGEKYLDFIKRIKADPRYKIHYEILSRLGSECKNLRSGDVFIGSDGCTVADRYYVKMGVKILVDGVVRAPIDNTSKIPTMK